VTTRYHTFQRTWLGRFFSQHGMAKEMLGINREPLCWRIWTSPDDERQVAVALRFVSTRVVFALARRCDVPSSASDWLNATVIEADEVVPDEMWRITTARPSNQSEGPKQTVIESFHIIFDTGEVVGRASPPLFKFGVILGQRVARNRPHFEVLDEPDETGQPLRADWAQYAKACELGEAPSLQDAITSGDRESYVAGISTFWLRSVADNAESQNGEVLKTIARRYVLSCVEPNR
jgi:hypothetical protein